MSESYAEFLKQIIYALDRAETALLKQADAMGMDYSAELPAEDAARMREAQRIIGSGLLPLASKELTAAGIKAIAEALVDAAKRSGVVLTIEQHSTWPPAMGAYVTTVEVRQARAPS